MAYLIIFIGGGVGSILRFMISQFFAHRVVENFPWSTLTANLIGSFLIGCIVGLFTFKFPASLALRYLLITGFLGGFTTFSAFSLESSLLWIKGDYALLAGYILSSMFGSIAMTMAGLHLIKFFS